MSYISEINLRVRARAAKDQVLKVYGNVKELGAWNLNDALTLVTNENSYPEWSTAEPIRVPRKTKLLFKFFLIGKDESIVIEGLPKPRTYRAKYQQVILSAEWNDSDGNENVLKQFQGSMSLIEDQEQYQKKKITAMNPFEISHDSSDDEIIGDESFTFSIQKGLTGGESESDDEKLEIFPRFKVLGDHFNNNDHYHMKSHMEHGLLKDIQEEEEEKQQQIINNHKKASLAMSSSTDELESIIIIQLYIPHLVIYDKSYQKCTAEEPKDYLNHFYNGAVKIFQRVRFVGYIRVLDKQYQKIMNLNDDDKSIIQRFILQNYGEIGLFMEMDLQISDAFVNQFYKKILEDEFKLEQSNDLDIHETDFEKLKKLNERIAQKVLQIDNQGIIVNDVRTILVSQYLQKQKYNKSIGFSFTSKFANLKHLKLIEEWKQICDSLINYEYIYLPSQSAFKEFGELMEIVYGCEISKEKQQMKMSVNGKDIYVKQFIKGIELRNDNNKEIPTQIQEYLLTNKIILGYNLLDKDIENLKAFNKQCNDKSLKIVMVDENEYKIRSLDAKTNEIFEGVQYQNEIWNSLVKQLMSNADCMILSGENGNKEYLVCYYILVNNCPKVLCNQLVMEQSSYQSVSLYNGYYQSQFVEKLNQILKKEIQINIEEDKSQIRNQRSCKQIELLVQDLLKVKQQSIIC